ncbi:EipA family protein [Escherichia coli]|uniref:EipA family protein n=1 Tax=Escherichia coli TaxID=562 RepID=UPI00202F8E7D|nr:EipA family protein [Escherichia coli]
MRYGEGTLYTKNAGDLRDYGQGPSLGFDWGGDGARTMTLVYNLPATNAIYQRFAGIDGSAYIIGGFGMTALTANNIVLVPIRSGLGLRLGASKVIDNNINAAAIGPQSPQYLSPRGPPGCPGAGCIPGSRARRAGSY